MGFGTTGSIHSFLQPLFNRNLQKVKVPKTPHYIADAAMPLHNSKHHDGWEGDNPKNYTRDTEIHGRFESQYVDLIQVSEADLLP